MKELKNQPSIDEGSVDITPKPLKIFVVDDDEYYNNLLQTYLLKIGVEVKRHIEPQGYLSGGECLAHIKDNPDFVILDFYLDENNDITLTGYDVLEKIKKYSTHIKVIVISQMHEWENFKDEFRRFGASDFLKKDDDLYENLKKLLSHPDIDVG